MIAHFFGVPTAPSVFVVVLDVRAEAQTYRVRAPLGTAVVRVKQVPCGNDSKKSKDRGRRRFPSGMTNGGVAVIAVGRPVRWGFWGLRGG
jgi:hypothetical protein